MRELRVFLAMALVLLWGLHAQAAEAEKGPVLFKGVHYGMSKKQVQSFAKTRIVPSQEADALMEEGVSFAGKKWTMFYFFEQGKLDRLVLAGGDDIRERQMAVIGAIVNNSFIFTALHTKNKLHDRVKTTRQVGEDVELKMMAEFEQEALKGRYVLYVFAPIDVLERYGRKAASHSELFDFAPDTTRQMEVEVDELNGQSFVRVKVSLPKKTKQDMVKQLESVKEKF